MVAVTAKLILRYFVTQRNQQTVRSSDLSWDEPVRKSGTLALQQNQENLVPLKRTSLSVKHTNSSTEPIKACVIQKNQQNALSHQQHNHSDTAPQVTVRSTLSLRNSSSARHRDSRVSSAGRSWQCIGPLGVQRPWRRSSQCYSGSLRSECRGCSALRRASEWWLHTPWTQGGGRSRISVYKNQIRVEYIYIFTLVYYFGPPFFAFYHLFMPSL